LWLTLANAAGYVAIIMRVVFKDPKFEEALRAENTAETGLPLAVIRSFNRKKTLMDSAPDERTLRNWKSLHYEKLQGDREGQRSIRLNDQWRLVFTLDERTIPPTIEVLGLEDYH
jgi:proteic killer suppression protein